MATVTRPLAPCLVATALAMAGCGGSAPSQKTLMAHKWVCQMTNEADGLRSEFTETVEFRPGGDYRSTADVRATKGDTKAFVNLEWAGRWVVTQGSFQRTFAGLKATSGEVNGAALTQDQLDAAAAEFRRGPTAEEGKILILDATQLKIETNFDPLVCTR